MGGRDSRFPSAGAEVGCNKPKTHTWEGWQCEGGKRAYTNSCSRLASARGGASGGAWHSHRRGGIVVSVKALSTKENLRIAFKKKNVARPVV